MTAVKNSLYMGNLQSSFRSFIPSEKFPAEQGRYILYVNYSCPWAHRTIILHGLKGLENIVQLVEVDARDPTHGWWFSGRTGPEKDPYYGVRWVKELYYRADPQYTGRYTIPVLWDRKQHLIVNNESSEIMRILISAFDEFLPFERREACKGAASLLPQHLVPYINTLNAWVHDLINNGVYKIGFATSQASYTENVLKLFEALDKLEAHMTSQNGPYAFGQYITEADVRIFTTLIRFDVVYYPLFHCNLKMIRTDYPRLHDWLRRLYWGDAVFKNTTKFDLIKRGYATVVAGNGIVPIGPLPNVMPWYDVGNWS